jgi:hypothetical protein
MIRNIRGRQAEATCCRATMAESGAVLRPSRPAGRLLVLFSQGCGRPNWLKNVVPLLFGEGSFTILIEDTGVAA